jgi:hypothetical protein
LRDRRWIEKVASDTEVASILDRLANGLNEGGIGIGILNAYAPANLPDKPAGSDDRRKVEAALTTAAIAAIIVQASRDQYHAGGGPARVQMTPCAMLGFAAQRLIPAGRCFAAELSERRDYGDDRVRDDDGHQLSLDWRRSCSATSKTMPLMSLNLFSAALRPNSLHEIQNHVRFLKPKI